MHQYELNDLVKKGENVVKFLPVQTEDKIMQNYDDPLPLNSRNSLENKSTNHLCQGNLFYEYCQLNR